MLWLPSVSQVTDFVCLMYRDWQDLREGYPEITKQFYKFAAQVRDRERFGVDPAHNITPTDIHKNVTK